ncbi:hypothetical protein RYX36_022414 [Vicia faba]
MPCVSSSSPKPFNFEAKQEDLANPIVLIDDEITSPEPPDRIAIMVSSHHLFVKIPLLDIPSFHFNTSQLSERSGVLSEDIHVEQGSEFSIEEHGPDEDLAAMSPREGYKVLDPPSFYVPIRSPARKLLATPTPMGTPLYQIPDENSFMSLCRFLFCSLYSSVVPPISIKLSFNSNCFVGSSLIRFYSQYGKKLCT